jgi:DNA-binding GntR family transcriptional regulator
MSEPVTSKRGGLTDVISKKIADGIAMGQFLPGARLDEVTLAGLYEVSRTPIREALKLLSMQGLVDCRPNRGAFVSDLSAGELALMFEAIGELEASCARYSAMRMGTAELKTLQELHLQSRQAMRAEDHERYNQLNEAWHQVIIESCGNPMLIEMTLSLRHRVAPFRRSQFRQVERMSESFEEHATILDALLAHDVSTCQRVMRAHLLSARSASTRAVELAAQN